MDIEQLSKVQIVLLTLLVSFVTSIATGIVTVSLMDQAPPSVAQTVNRIIERTVQTVVPSGQSASAAVVTQEKTVVVKESDLISQAVAGADPSVVRLYSSAADSPAFLGLGVILDASGTIASDMAAFGGAADGVAELADGSHVRVFITSRDAVSGIALLTAATTTIDGKTPAWAPATVSTDAPVLGETVVELAGKTVTRIADGIITALVPAASDAAPQTIETNIAPDSILAGSPLIDTNGSFIGISTGAARAAGASDFIPASTLMKDSAPPGGKI
jgi:hypothetical protein